MILILGGGTAGWMTALRLNTEFPDKKIIVVASEEIPIIGAGESTLAAFKEFLQEVSISEKDLILNADATIKYGTKFKNWTGDDSSYIIGTLALPEGKHHLGYKTLAYMDRDTDVCVSSQCVLREKVISDIPAFQVDAAKAARYFKEVAISRGVMFREDTYLDCVVEDGKVTQVRCEKETFCPEFVVDCSGFRREIIGKALKAEWESYTPYLPLSDAYLYFEPLDEHLPTYTEATAMKHGWKWKIPTQKRYGCGYVFSKKHASEEDIIAEIGNDTGRFVSFSAGAFKEPVQGNVVAIGLSAGFLEPLEASSIMMICVMLQSLVSYEYFRGSFQASTRANRDMQHVNAITVAFVSAHYLGGRQDTEFWRSIPSLKAHPKLLEVLKHVKENTFYKEYQHGIEAPLRVYNPTIWASMFGGLRILEKEMAQELNGNYEGYREFFKTRTEVAMRKAIPHKEYINILKQGQHEDKSVRSVLPA